MKNLMSSEVYPDLQGEKPNQMHGMSLNFLVDFTSEVSTVQKATPSLHMRRQNCAEHKHVHYTNIII